MRLEISLAETPNHLRKLCYEKSIATFSMHSLAGCRSGGANEQPAADAQSDIEQVTDRLLVCRRFMGGIARRWRSVAVDEWGRQRVGADRFAWWRLDRFHRRIRWQHRCLCHTRERRRAAKIDIPSGQRYSGWLDTRQQAGAVSIGPRQCFGALSAPLHDGH